MEGLPLEICFKIFHALDYRNLATVQQVCWKWRVLASDDNLWSNLFRDRWGADRAEFYAPVDRKSWKFVYEVQDRCDRFGLGPKIMREGGDYYVVHQGEIHLHLGPRNEANGRSSSSEREVKEESESGGILDNIFFFIGDLEVALANAKRARLV